MAAYANSLHGTFVLDDASTIVSNPHLLAGEPVWTALAGTIRPVVQLTFALNHAWGGFDVRGYHLVNVALHLAVALLWYGLVHRLLCAPNLRVRWADHAQPLALAAALLWVVHPLTTQSVTYLSQRAEQLMALWYLLALHCLIRGRETQRGGQWTAVAAACAAAGMASKVVIVTLPIAAWLIDGACYERSFAQAWRTRRPVYGALAASWLLWPLLAAQIPPTTKWSAGPRFTDLTVWDYARMQPGVVLHYLRLALWPSPLCFDYTWRMATRWSHVLGPGAAVAGLMAAALWGLARRAAPGIFAVLALLILAPSSSVIPIADAAAEHRMYLPLAAFIAALVTLGHALWQRLPMAARQRRSAAILVVGGAAMALGLATIDRNRDYRSAMALWQDTASKRPDNPRAHAGMASQYLRDGRYRDAAYAATAAVQLDPGYADAYNTLGNALAELGFHAEAVRVYMQALHYAPHHGQAHSNLAIEFALIGRHEDAIAHFQQALRVRPDWPEVRFNLGMSYASAGRAREALAEFDAVKRLAPQLWAARLRADPNLNRVLASLRRATP